MPCQSYLTTPVQSKLLIQRLLAQSTMWSCQRRTACGKNRAQVLYQQMLSVNNAQLGVASDLAVWVRANTADIFKIDFYNNGKCCWYDSGSSDGLPSGFARQDHESRGSGDVRLQRNQKLPQTEPTRGGGGALTCQCPGGGGAPAPPMLSSFTGAA